MPYSKTLTCTVCGEEYEVQVMDRKSLEAIEADYCSEECYNSYSTWNRANPTSEDAIHL